MQKLSPNCRQLGAFSLVLALTWNPAAVADDDLLGQVDMAVSCAPAVQSEFEDGVIALHNMMYEQARSTFERAASADPDCAMAYWGIAMTRFTPFWGAADSQSLERGQAAIEAARAAGPPTARERAYIDAAAAYLDPPTADRDHGARLRAWQQAQRDLHQQFPDDVDAAAFYGLARLSYAYQFEADPAYTVEREVGAMLEQRLEHHPRHPGLHHYLIHAYDNPELASRGEQVARAYDSLAPDSAHPLHMPSHILSRLGEWEDVAQLNERSAEAAASQPLNGMQSMHYPHALDYQMFAYLQLGDEDKARATLERVEGIQSVQPLLASAWGIAAARARFHVEREDWAGAAALEPNSPNALPWERFPAARALFHYARGLGAARLGDLDQARGELERLEAAVHATGEAGDTYYVDRVRVLAMTVESWIAHAQGDVDSALARMGEAADLEDSMEVNPVHAGPVRDARELYGQMLLLEERPAAALDAFQASLERVPGRTLAERGIEQAQQAMR